MTPWHVLQMHCFFRCTMVRMRIGSNTYRVNFQWMIKESPSPCVGLEPTTFNYMLGALPSELIRRDDYSTIQDWFNLLSQINECSGWYKFLWYVLTPLHVSQMDWLFRCTMVRMKIKGNISRNNFEIRSKIYRCQVWGLHPWPPNYTLGALPTELTRQNYYSAFQS